MSASCPSTLYSPSFLSSSFMIHPPPPHKPKEERTTNQEKACGQIWSVSERAGCYLGQPGRPRFPVRARDLTSGVISVSHRGLWPGKPTPRTLEADLHLFPEHLVRSLHLLPGWTHPYKEPPFQGDREINLCPSPRSPSVMFSVCS